MKFDRFLTLSLLAALTLAGVGCGSDAVVVNSSNSSNAPASTAQTSANSSSSIPANGDPAAASTEPPKGAVPAPENSEFELTLSDVGKETRTFKGHTVLDKVEKTVTPDGQTVKVFLKNGKVVEIDADKIGPLKTESSANILAAAGIKYVPPTPGTLGDVEPPADNPRPVKKPE
jgi:hypothetical protein